MMRKILSAALFSAALPALMGCPEQKSIAAIQRDPGYYQHRDVGVVGTVTDSFGGLGRGVYEIDDGTGRMWVYSDRLGVPSKGARVATHGRVLPTFTFAGQSFVTVMQEVERKHR